MTALDASKSRRAALCGSLAFFRSRGGTGMKWSFAPWCGSSRPNRHGNLRLAIANLVPSHARSARPVEIRGQNRVGGSAA